VSKLTKIMSQFTNIQWSDGTVNPLMGCLGCELWPKPAMFIAEMVKQLTSLSSKSVEQLRILVKETVGDRETGEIYRDRKFIAAKLQKKLALTKAQRYALVDIVRRLCKCYAGLLGTMRAGHPGYANSFDEPKLFPGRMVIAAKWPEPSPSERLAKPWLDGSPRLIFVSDMGDALSNNVPFNYLHDEIISSVTSDAGLRHLWLWLTKRPERMAKFAQWLSSQGTSWPENLVAMTTVTSASTLNRIDALRKVPARFRGLSIEPLYTAVKLDLTGIDWAIVGGGSDVLAEPFQIEWAEDIRRQCQAAGVAFFLKQMGKNPVHCGVPLKLLHRHGGDWSEWPAHLRVREIPDGFRNYKPASQQQSA
jgi:protein gp37